MFVVPSCFPYLAPADSLPIYLFLSLHYIFSGDLHVLFGVLRPNLDLVISTHHAELAALVSLHYNQLAQI